MKLCLHSKHPSLLFLLVAWLGGAKLPQYHKWMVLFYVPGRFPHGTHCVFKHVALKEHAEEKNPWMHNNPFLISFIKSVISVEGTYDSWGESTSGGSGLHNCERWVFLSQGRWALRQGEMASLPSIILATLKFLFSSNFSYLELYFGVDIKTSYFSLVCISHIFVHPLIFFMLYDFVLDRLFIQSI